MKQHSENQFSQLGVLRELTSGGCSEYARHATYRNSCLGYSCRGKTTASQVARGPAADVRVAFGVLRRLDDARQYRTELDRSHGVAREVAEQIFEELLALLVVRSTERTGN